MLSWKLLATFASLSCAVMNADIVLVGTGNMSSPGNVVTASLQIDGLGTGSSPSLGGFDVNILYDPAALEFLSASFIDPASSVNQLDFPELGGLGFLGAALDLGSAVDVFGVSGNSAAVLNANQLNAFTLFTLSFKALSSSQTTIGLDLLDPNLLFGDENGVAVSQRFGNVSAVYESGSSAVPEPGTWVLLLTIAPAVLLKLRRSGGRK